MGKRRPRRTRDDDFNSFVENYRSLVSRGATMEEVVEYGLEKKQLLLPKAKTAKEILIQQFTRAQRKQMRDDEVLKLKYNANVCFPWGDEVRWANTDKEAKQENLEYSNHRRRTMAIGLLTNAERNRLHWNRTRTANEHLAQLELDLGPDVLWNLNQDQEEGTGTDN